MNEIQKVEFEALKAIVKVCDENNIDYMIAAGTLLGAVRHGGFIPWDDDIDLLMTAENYKKFIQIGQEALGEKYFVQNCETEFNYYELWTQVRVINTTSMPIMYKKWDINWGVSIDIFPIIDLPDRSQDRKKLKKYFDWHRLLLIDEFYKSTGEKFPWKLKFLYSIPRSIRKTICRKLDDYIFLSKPDCSRVAGVWYKLVEFPKKIFEERTFVKFEGKQFKTMKNYKDYLKYNYGDYMQLPSEDQRIGHNSTLGEIIFDTEKSFEYYK